MPLYVCAYPAGVAEGNVEIQVYHARPPHKPGLHDDNNRGADTKIPEHTIVFVRQAEDRPVPGQVQEEDNDSKRIVDAAAIVAFRFHPLTTHFTLIIQCEAFIQRKDALVDEYKAFSATGTFHAQQGGN